jgi:hypothetical protein
VTAAWTRGGYRSDVDGIPLDENPEPVVNDRTLCPERLRPRELLRAGRDRPRLAPIGTFATANESA